MVPFEPEQPPSVTGKPVLIVYGRHDPIAPPASARRLGEILQGGGAEVRLFETDEGHGIPPAALGVVRGWLEEHFGGE